MSKRKKQTRKQTVEYTESGISVNMPDKQHFRFESLKTYQKLSGTGIKEMDFCWLKGGFDMEKTFVLMEIWNKAPEQTVIEDLTGKVIDSLMMLASLWLPNGYLCKDVPGSFHTPPNSIEVFIIMRGDINVHDNAHHLVALKDILNSKLKSRLRLFNIEEVMVLDNNNRTVIKKLGLEAYLPE